MRQRDSTSLSAATRVQVHVRDMRSQATALVKLPFAYRHVRHDSGRDPQAAYEYGSWTFSINLMAACAQFAIDWAIPLGHVFTDTFTLDQANEANRQFEARTMGKGVFLFDG